MELLLISRILPWELAAIQDTPTNPGAHVTGQQSSAGFLSWETVKLRSYIKCLISCITQVYYNFWSLTEARIYAAVTPMNQPQLGHDFYKKKKKKQTTKHESWF